MFVNQFHSLPVMCLMSLSRFKGVSTIFGAAHRRKSPRGRYVAGVGALSAVYSPSLDKHRSGVFRNCSSNYSMLETFAVPVVGDMERVLQLQGDFRRTLEPIRVRAETDC